MIFTNLPRITYKGTKIYPKCDVQMDIDEVADQFTAAITKSARILASHTRKQISKISMETTKLIKNLKGENNRDKMELELNK